MKDNKKLKILLDPQIYLLQNYGGISRYYSEIFNSLFKNDLIDFELPLIFSKNEYLKNVDLLSSKSKKIQNFYNFLNKIGISTRKKITKINDRHLKKAFSKQDFDLFIPTYYNPYFIEYINNKPFVVTVYDMIHEIFPQYFVDDSHNVVQNKKILIEKASKIIAVSNNTKKDILKIYPHIEPEKIEVIYHGTSIQVQESKINLPNKFLLFVGSRSFYKNFSFLINSIDKLLLNDSDLKLVCAGGGKFTDKELNELSSLNLQNKVIQLEFNENELGYIYNKAICFIFPSEYEGFGIPVLESMKCECPIILPNNSSFPEVAENAGIFYELNNSEDLMDKINLVIYDEKFRTSFIQKGNEQAKKFEWDIAAKKCLNLYQKAI